MANHVEGGAPSRAVWYFDRSYLKRVWQALHREDCLSLDRLRDYLEGRFDGSVHAVGLDA